MTFKLRPGVNSNIPITGTERHYRINPDNSQTTIATGSPLISREASHVQGYDVEGYHKMKRNGDLIPISPWYQYSSSMAWTGRLHYSQPSVPYNWKTDSNWSHPTSLVTGYDQTEASIVSIANSKDTTRYVQQAAASIYSSGFDALTFLSELHKTVAMYKNAVTRISGLLGDYGKYRARKGAAATFAEFWLEYRYGWRLLYYDMVDISHTLADLGYKRDRFRQSSGTNQDSTTTGTYQYNGPAYQFTVSVTDELKISLRGTVVADIEPPTFRFNPLTTSWELIRFSFIIDWFIGIGQWLETISFLALSSNHTSAGGMKISLKRSWVLTNKSSSAGYSIIIMESSGQSIASLTQRNPQSVSNFPLINIRLDVPKVADLLAIIYSFYSGSNPGPGTRL